MRASERRSHEGLALASPFAWCSCVTSGGIPQKLPRSLSNYTCPVFRLILFFGTRSENVLESRNLIFLNEFMAHEKCDPHSQTQRKNSSRNSHSISLVRSIELATIFLNPLTGKMKRVLPSDWLPSPSCYLGISRFSPAG